MTDDTDRTVETTTLKEYDECLLLPDEYFDPPLPDYSEGGPQSDFREPVRTTLVGSIRQVLRAGEIRERMIAELTDDSVDRYAEPYFGLDEHPLDRELANAYSRFTLVAYRAMERVCAIDDASWFVENEGLSGLALVESLVGRCSDLPDSFWW